MAENETWEEAYQRRAKEREEAELATFKKWVRRIGGGIFAFVAICVVFSSLFQIGERERGVVLRWGKLNAIADPGLHIKMPFRSDVVVLPIDNQTTTEEKMSAGSKDQQEAIMRASVNWRLNPEHVGEFYSRFGSLKNAELAYVKPRLNARAKVVFGQFTAETTFSNRGPLNSAIQNDLQANLGELFIVDGVQIEDVDFGTQYTLAVNQRMTAQVEVEKERQKLEREKVLAAIANTQADAEKYRVQAEGDAKAHATRVTGEAEASAIKAKADALKENPGLVQLELAGRWNGITPSTYIGDGKGALPILPLGNNALEPLKPVYSNNR